MITSANTSLVGLIGWPVGHSLSPTMHNAAFAACGLDWCYLPLPVPVSPRDRIGEAIRGLRALGLRGANVTVPHKRAVIEHLDVVDDAATRIGAVNTIWLDARGRLCGENTDAPGLCADLRALGVELEGCRALILGAGGSARAALVGLADAGCAEITVLNRAVGRARALVDAFDGVLTGVTLRADAFPAALAQVNEGCDLIVHCTPVGMAPAAKGLPWDPAVPIRPTQVVYDLVYNPAETALMRLARASGARASNGLGMLLEQGALAFERWTGQAAPRDVMRAALDDSFGAA